MDHHHATTRHVRVVWRRVQRLEAALRRQDAEVEAAVRSREIRRLETPGGRAWKRGPGLGRRGLGGLEDWGVEWVKAPK